MWVWIEFFFFLFIEVYWLSICFIENIFFSVWLSIWKCQEIIFNYFFHSKIKKKKKKFLISQSIKSKQLTNHHQIDKNQPTPLHRPPKPPPNQDKLLHHHSTNHSNP